MAGRYDAMIIGGGHKGLVCGAYLAKAGVKTLVLERRYLLGGAAVTEAVFPGYRMSVASYVMSLLSPRVINDLELRRFGLVVLPANDLFSPIENGDHIFLHDDVAKTQQEFAPGFSSRVIDMQVLLPPDLEEIFALPQGYIFHGEPLPDQLFFQRPAAHYADYRTPIRNLYLCGSSSHPGGAVSGIPGHNAAREILRDQRRWR
jgi:phytoene dehydrogenase-like protein